ncbi:hypothetical protein [Pedobacter steynii]|nr:hypothetical protein [Pedobacter steynii]
MKYKYLFIFLLSINCTSIYAQKKVNNQKISSDYREVILGTTEEYQKLPHLKLKSASAEDFDQLPETNFWTMPKVEKANHHFYIQTSKGKQKFKIYSNEGNQKGWNGYELLGYSHLLSLYAISSNSSSEGIGFGELFLLDPKNSFKYHISSFGDWYVSLPVPSTQHKNFAYYHNTQYQHKNSDIGILKFNAKAAAGKAFKPVASLHSDEFAVEEMRWADDNILYIKGFEEIYNCDKWIKKYKYYRAALSDL